MRGFSPLRFFDHGGFPLDRRSDRRPERSDHSAIADEVRHQSNRIDALQHTIVVVGGSLFAAFVAFLVAVVGLIITLLVTHL